MSYPQTPSLTPPPNPSLIRLLAGYAQWVAHLAGVNPDWQADDLNLDSLRQSHVGFGETGLDALQVYQSHFSGTDWNGPFDRPAYLCLCEAEAKMVAGEVQHPSRKVSRLHFTDYLHVRHETIPLTTLLASPDGRKHLHDRLRSLTPYTPADYAQADSLCWSLEGGQIRHFLYLDSSLLPPQNPDRDLLREMCFGNLLQVWSAEGLGGLINGDGHIILPCRYGYLSSPHDGLIEARTAPLPPVNPLVGYWDFLDYTCDILDYKTGRRVNPPGVVALQASLFADEPFIARKVDMDPAKPSMGFMNREGSREGAWLGRSDWADVLLFNERRAAVQCPDTGLWGFIDDEGHVAVPPRYARGSFFNGGVAIVALPDEQAVNGASWILIDTKGQPLSEPWHDIDPDRGRTYLVQDGVGRWGLINRRGQILVAPMVMADGIAEEERTALIRECHNAQRQGIAANRLASLPLAEAVAGFELSRDRDFFAYGLWGRKVSVLRVPAHWQHEFGPTTQGEIGWCYPVSASLFDFEQEAPVILNRQEGEPLTLGIPWKDLELCR